MKTLLILIATAALVWLGRSFITSDTVSPIVIVVILGLLLAVLLFRKVSKKTKREAEMPPSQRKKSHEHKSWISRGGQD